MRIGVGFLVFISEGKPVNKGLDGGHVRKVAQGDIEVKSEVLEDNFHFFNSLVVFSMKEIYEYIVLSS